MSENELIENVKAEVLKVLITKHDMLSDEAETAIEESLIKDQGMWNVNAMAEDIADYLASDEDDE